MSPKFFISMLALDGLDLSRACIKSVLAHSTAGTFRLYLTNNGSTDGTRQYFDDLAATHECITVLHNDKNECFIGPNNHAFEQARKAGATYFITLNNDLIVPEGWLEKLEAEFMSHEKAAIVGPKGTISHLNAQMLGYSREKLDYIEGSMLCAKVAIVEQFGSFFSPYLVDIYHDDSDLCLRMQRAGYTIHQAEFHVEHRNGSTCMRHPDAVRRCAAANAHNQQVMMKKWAHWNKTRRFDTPILVRRWMAAGDALLTTPIIRALHQLWPLCPIDVETNHPTIFMGNPFVRRVGRVIPHDGWTRVINLDGTYERNPQRHVLYSYAEAADVEAATVSCKTDLFFSPNDSEKLPEARWCAMHVGATAWPGKNWHVTRFNEVAQIMRKDGWKIMLFGGPSREVVQVDKDMRGQDGVQELAALIAQCQLFVGLDSFPMHVAQAVGVPVVGLFGITDPKCFLTGGSPAIAVCSDPLHPDTGRRNREPNKTFILTTDSVMRTITVEQVMSAVMELTDQTPPPCRSTHSVFS